MSSSDDSIIEKSTVTSKWTPLVPGRLEQHRVETDDVGERKDPELEKAFKALYDQEQGTKKHFSLLYSKSEEDEVLDDEEAYDAEPIEEEGGGDESVVESEPELPDFEAIKRDAYEEGFSQGKAEGYEAGIQSAAEQTERLNLVLNEVEVLWKTLLKNSEQKIIELIAVIAEKVVYGNVAVDNAIITRAILDVFEKIPDPVNATITVNPDDYEYIEVVKDDFFEEIKGLKQVSIVSDQLIEPGGCRIETSAGEVDTSIEERLEAVKTSVINIAGKLNPQ